MIPFTEILERAGYEPLDFKQVGRGFVDSFGTTVYAARYYGRNPPCDVEVTCKADGSWSIDFGDAQRARNSSCGTVTVMNVMGGK